jgi:hypothetical protein
MSGPILHKIMHHPMAGKVMSGVLEDRLGDGAPPELAISGDNFTAADWTSTDGSVTFSGGRAVWTATPSARGITQGTWGSTPDDQGFEASTTYDIELTVFSHVSGNLRLRLENGGTFLTWTLTGPGVYTGQAVIGAAPTGAIIQLLSSGTLTASVSRLSIKKAA